MAPLTPPGLEGAAKRTAASALEQPSLLDEQPPYLEQLSLLSQPIVALRCATPVEEDEAPVPPIFAVEHAEGPMRTEFLGSVHQSDRDPQHKQSSIAQGSTTSRDPNRPTPAQYEEWSKMLRIDREFRQTIRSTADTWAKSSLKQPEAKKMQPQHPPEKAVTVPIKKAPVVKTPDTSNSNTHLVSPKLDDTTFSISLKESKIAEQLACIEDPDDNVTAESTDWAGVLAASQIQLTDPIMDAMLREEEELERAEQLKNQQIRNAEVHVLHALAQKLNAVCSRGFPHLTPVKALNEMINICFEQGRLYASHIFRCLCQQLDIGTWNGYLPIVLTRDPLPSKETVLEAAYVWDHHVTATSFVMALAAGPEKVVSACNFIRAAMPQGAPTLQYIEDRPSDSLEEVYKTAKQTAQIKKMPDWTVIGVCMIDMAWERLRAVGKEKGLTSLNHSFVMVIGPLGATVYQAWRVCPADGRTGLYDGCEDRTCEHSLSFDEWMRDGGGVLDWENADTFVGNIGKLVLRKGPMRNEDRKSKQITGYFEKCFGVNLRKVCQKGGAHRPLIDEVDLKTRVKVLHRLSEADVGKYTWK